MPIEVYDYRRDIANVVVRPEIRARFMRMEPSPAGSLHSHDLGGEIFLVLDGQCEFLVGDERVTCGPGQLIYVDKLVRHTLHAVGDQPCTVYLSVTPHVEPTHTQYDEASEQVPPRYGTWRGRDHGDPSPDVPTSELAERYAAAVRELATLAAANAEAQLRHLGALRKATTEGDQATAKRTMDEMWLALRSVLQQASEVETDWNALAPRAMPTK